MPQPSRFHKKWLSFINESLPERSEKGRRFRIFFFLSLLLPVLITASLSLVTTYRELTALTLSRRESIAYLAALSLREKFQRLRDLGTALGSRAQFRLFLKEKLNRLSSGLSLAPLDKSSRPHPLLTEKDWTEAKEILKQMPLDFPFVDRILLTDPSGNLLADVPSGLEIPGKNLADHDWYRGVSREWKPYTSSAYQRSAEPQYNVVAVAHPIKLEDGHILGILVFQIRFETFLEWTKSIEVGPSGFVYFVDQKGQAVGHPRFPAQGKIADFSSVPAVDKVLKRQRGVEVLYNSAEKEERLTAYEPVLPDGWGAFAVQPESVAFKARNDYLKILLTVYAVLFFLNGFFAFLLLRLVRERRQAEEVVRETERRYSDLIETAPDPIITLNILGLIRSVNSAAEMISGYRAEEILGRHFIRLGVLTPESIPRAVKEFGATLMGMEQPPFELNLIRKDRTVLTIEAHCRPIRKENKIIGALVVMRDMTERKQTEAAIRASEEKFRTVTESAQDAIISANQQGDIVFWNKAAQSIFGYKEKEVAGKPLTLIMPERFREAHQKGLARFNKTGERRVIGKTLELAGLRKDGSEFPLEISISHGNTQEASFFTAVIRDITGRKQAEEALREREMVQTKAELVSVVSHELRTPLQAIKEGISIVLDGSAGTVAPEQKEFLELAARNVDRLGRLINDVLEFQKLESQGITYNFQPHDLNEIVSEALETMTPLAHTKSLKLKLELAKNLPPLALDRDRILQVLMNLINNAIKFTDKGIVTVTTSSEKGSVGVRVSDTGIGIKEQSLPKLFQTFGQVDTGRGRKTGGTGLGLAISKKIIEQHGGKIWAESRYGAGSSFLFQLPPTKKELQKQIHE